MKSVLAVWFAIVSVGVTISHAHAAPDARHVHGFGWNCLCCSQLRAADGDDPARPGEPHCHFILLGCELPGEAAPPDGAAVQGVLDYEATGAAGDSPAADAGAILAGLVGAPGLGEVAAPPVPIPSPLPSSPPLSAFASRALAGVLRS